MPTVTVILWNHEPVYESPARKTFNVNWEGELLRADLSVDVDPNFLLLGFNQYLQKIVVNGTEVNFIGDRNNVVSADLRSVLRRGANYIEIYHNAFSLPGIQTAGMYAYLTVESSGPVGGEIAPPAGEGGGQQIEIPIWVWIIFVMILMVVILR